MKLYTSNNGMFGMYFHEKKIKKAKNLEVKIAKNEYDFRNKVMRTPYIAEFIDEKGSIRAELVSKRFGFTKIQVAEMTGLKREALHRQERAVAQPTQSRLKEMLEIVGRVAEWAGGEVQAVAWYRGEPLPSFGGRTAESLVKDGKAAAVRDFLDRVATGGFA